MRMRLALPLAACALLSLAAAQGGSAPVKLGVVDVNRLFQDYKKKGELEHDLAQIKERMEEKLALLKKKMEPIAKELELLEKGTERYRDLEKQLFSITQESNYEVQSTEQEFTRRKQAFREQLIADIHRAIAEYGRAGGYTLIVQREFTLPERALAESWQSVLYHAPELDVTPAIHEALNR